MKSKAVFRLEDQRGGSFTSIIFTHDYSIQPISKNVNTPKLLSIHQL